MGDTGREGWQHRVSWEVLGPPWAYRAERAPEAAGAESAGILSRDVGPEGDEPETQVPSTQQKWVQAARCWVWLSGTPVAACPSHYLVPASVPRDLLLHTLHPGGAPANHSFTPENRRREREGPPALPP